MCSFEEEKGNARADVGHDGIVNIKHELTPILALNVVDIVYVVVNM